MGTAASETANGLKKIHLEEVVIRIAGNSQDGIQSVGDMLSRLSGRSKRGVITFQTFPSTISGGPSIFQLRVGGHRLKSAGDEADVLIAFYQHSYRDHIKALRKGGLLIYDADHVTPDPDEKRFHHVGVPMTSLTIEAIGGTAKDKGKNLFLMGLVARLFDLESDKLEDQIKDRFGSKGPKVLDPALKAYHAGYSYDISKIGELFEIEKDPIGRSHPQVCMDGNQALAYGAIAAGIRFGAGYPITPWSSVMEILRAQLPKFGGTFMQAEDEIASIAMAIGAAYGGTLAMTGSSGPGLSLKSEIISYAVMAEVPILVVDVMRGGPSTGLPTNVEQSDLNLALYAGHGDTPRIVIAPFSVRDVFHSVVEAVQLMQEYNCPVIFLSDYSLATRVETWPEPNLKESFHIYKPDLSPKGPNFLPYKDTPSGVSERITPGVLMLDGNYPTISGLEHNEAGHPDGSPAMHTKMTAKRRRKLQALREKLPAPTVYGPESGEVLLVGWGSTKGPIEEAVDQLRKEGMEISSTHIKYLSPLQKGIDKIMDRFKHVFVVEMNDSGIYGYGQLAMLLRAAFANNKISGINKTDGLPFKVREIVSAVKSKVMQTVHPSV